MYYSSRMISSQYGTEFEKSHYEKIRKVCSVWVCLASSEVPGKYDHEISDAGRTRIRDSDGIPAALRSDDRGDDLPGRHRETGRKQRRRKKETARKNGDRYPVGAGGSGGADNPQAALLRLLNVLFSAALTPKRKSRILEEEFQIPQREKMEQEMRRMGNLGQEIEDRALARGMELGRQEGIDIGEERKSVDIARNLIMADMDESDIAEWTGLSPERIRKLKK